MDPLPLLLAAASATALIAVTARLIRQRRALEQSYPFEIHPLPATPPLVSILVPARNEARNIADCLRSLQAQDYPAFEILVLDDGSDDATLAIARDIAGTDDRVRVFHGDGPAPGWIGKCHALHTLVREARGAWLFFVDADTIHAPSSLAAGVGYAAHHHLRGLSCSGPRILASFWEKVWEPLWPTLLFYWLDPRALNDPASSVHFAIGQWLLIERGAYDQIGGHEAVRAEIVEDCALAARLRSAGLPYRMLLSTRLYRARMYRGLGEIWEGWSKNSYRALGWMGVGTFGVAATVAALPLITIVPFVLGTLAGTSKLVAFGPLTLALLVSLGLRLAQRSHPAYFWSLPLAGALATAILLNSTWRARTGRPVLWKGRAYPGGVPRA